MNQLHRRKQGAGGLPRARVQDFFVSPPYRTPPWLGQMDRDRHLQASVHVYVTNNIYIHVLLRSCHYIQATMVPYGTGKLARNSCRYRCEHQ